MSYDESDLIRRAMSAWFRSGGIDQPANTSGVVEHEGKPYVVLKNVNGTLAIYRVRNDGTLKRLRRWPAELKYSPAEQRAMAADLRRWAETEADEERKQRRLNAARCLENLAALQEHRAQKAREAK
jgi:hypothetical protein